MCVSKRNAEGYFDPTAYSALTRIWKEEQRKTFKPLVFICSPYAGDTQTNASKARQYCRFAVEKNCIPIAPHLFFTPFLDDSDEEERDLGLFFGKVLLSKCAEVWVFGPEITEEMSGEIIKAKHRCMPVRHFDNSCREVSQL